jgi:hypothetical protein
VLSIEYASGGSLSALGSKARECLERCKKHDPEVRAVPIPTRGGALSSVPITASDPARSGPAEAADKSQGHHTSKKAATVVSADKRQGHAVEEAPGQHAAGGSERDGERSSKPGGGEQQDPARQMRLIEATACKDRGNSAFKQGKYANAIMHYSAAIDLVVRCRGAVLVIVSELMSRLSLLPRHLPTCMAVENMMKQRCAAP